MKEGPLMMVPPEQIIDSASDAANTSDLRFVSVPIAHRLQDAALRSLESLRAGWMSVKRRTVSATGELLRRMRHVIATEQGRHSAAHMAARPVHPPVPPPPMPVADTVELSASSSVVYEDPPTLPLPRIPAAERFPIVWDADPVGLYVVRYERERALGVAR